MNADVIIIGAGSAGCVLANRLSADPKRQVLLIEAGGSDVNPLFRIPLMTGPLLKSRYANWCYQTEPDNGTDGRRIDWPRGRVLGGSSTINGMIWTRGRPSDYDGWAQAGLRNWGWDSVERAFGVIERGTGADGVPVNHGTHDNPLYDVFLEAAAAAGFPATQNFNAPPYEGVGRYHFNIAAGQRWSSARVFLQPVRARANLCVKTKRVVTRILLERGRAIGIEVLSGRRVERHLAGEIILAAGAVNSPQILMLSGIGPADHLRALNVPVQHDLPGVGQNLQDHVAVRVQYECREPITLHSLTRIDRALLAIGQAVVQRRGPASNMPLGVGFLLRSDPGATEPDLQGFFMPTHSQATLRVPGLKAPLGGDRHAFTLSMYPLRPHSRGAITLRSPDPREPPSIRPRYLSDPRDIEMTRQGVGIARRIFGQQPFDRYRGDEMAPGVAIASDAEIDAWIRRVGVSGYHPVGTCKMGRAEDRLAVVDDQLRLHGIERLRVADASIMPTITSGNTNAPSIMIGQRCAEFIGG